MVAVEAPNSRATSVASLESSVWLMVAKMLRSISFLITRLALTSSFSESSLTVMPSEMVISRLMGGGPASTWRRCGRRIFSSSCRSRGCGRDGRLSPGRPRAGSTGGGASPAPCGRARWDAAGAVRPATRRGAPGGHVRDAPPWAGRDEWVRDKSAGREPGALGALGIPGRGAAAGPA